MGFFIYKAVYTIFQFYGALIIIYILLSWFPNKRGIIADIDHVLGTLCDPYLNLFRRFIPPIGGSGLRIDISPIIAIIVLEIITNLMLRVIATFIF